jgi:probable blue pigment (indigoidine) exporter
MGKQTQHPVWIDVLITALAPAIWGSTYIVTTELLPPDRPFTAAVLRTLPAGLLLVVYSRRLLRWWTAARPPRKSASRRQRRSRAGA